MRGSTPGGGTQPQLSPAGEAPGDAPSFLHGGPPSTSAATDRTIEEAVATNRETLKALFPLPAPAGTRGRGQPGESIDAVVHAASAAIAHGPDSPLKAASPRTRRVGPRGTATGFGLAVALALGIYALDPAYRSERHTTDVGELREVQLADGSRLTLDTATTVAIAWHLRGRRATLSRGRAQFEVAHSATDFGRRPFEVSAGDSRVRVLGTVFEVRLDEAQTTVTVLKGQVQVRLGTEIAERPDPQPLVLSAGEQWGRGEDGSAWVRPVDATATTAWREGRWVFQDVPLMQALQEVQRYRRSAMRLHDDPAAPLAALRLSGVFETSQAEQLLDLLPRILPVRADRQADGSVDVRPATGR